jgi:hypothetical protein
MNGMGTPRRLAARGTLSDGTRVTIDVTQPAGGARATGTFRLLDRRGAPLFDTVDLGVLQTTTKWASFTGIARATGSSDVRAFTATIEQADPFVAGHPRTLLIERQGGPPVRGVLK